MRRQAAFPGGLLRNSTFPAASAPCTWNTCFAMSKPIMVAGSMDASFGGSSTPSPWHTDAVGGRPPHHPIEPVPVGVANGRCGAQRTVRVAQAERRLWAQKGDGPGNAPQRARGADCGPSRPCCRTERFDPLLPFTAPLTSVAPDQKSTPLRLCSRTGLAWRPRSACAQKRR